MILLKLVKKDYRSHEKMHVLYFSSSFLHNGFRELLLSKNIRNQSKSIKKLKRPKILEIV